MGEIPSSREEPDDETRVEASGIGRERTGRNRGVSLGGVGGRKDNEEELDDGEWEGVEYGLGVGVGRGRGRGRMPCCVGVSGVFGSDGTVGSGRCLRARGGDGTRGSGRGEVGVRGDVDGVVAEDGGDLVAWSRELEACRSAVSGVTIGESHP